MFTMLGRKMDADSNQQAAPASTSNDDEDDLPF